LSPFRLSSYQYLRNFFAESCGREARRKPSLEEFEFERVL
jgi:hypothetical protein